MNDSQEQHLKDIIEETSKRLNIKYRKGASEHGGDLQDMSARDLIDNAIDEGIDEIVYLITLRTKLSELETELAVAQGLDRV